MQSGRNQPRLTEVDFAFLFAQTKCIMIYRRSVDAACRTERYNIIDNFQAAYHIWMIVILLQECYIMMYINFYFISISTLISLYNCDLTTTVIKRICYVSMNEA